MYRTKNRDFIKGNRFWINSSLARVCKGTNDIQQQSYWGLVVYKH